MQKYITYTTSKIKEENRSAFEFTKVVVRFWLGLTKLLQWCYMRVMGFEIINFAIVCSMTWWCHQMKTFSVLLDICAGNSPVTGEFPTQRPVTRSFDVFFDLHLNKQLSKQLWGWWFETPSHLLSRHCNEMFKMTSKPTYQWPFVREIQVLTEKVSPCHDIITVIEAILNLLTPGRFE